MTDPKHTNTVTQQTITSSFASPLAKEYRYFAWYPVPTADRGWRWLMPVYKRKYAMHQHLNNVYHETFFMYSVEKGVLR